MDDIDDFLDDEIKTPKEIAKRALAVVSVWYVACHTENKRPLLKWLKKYDLLQNLTNEEANFINRENPPQQDRINFSWHCERLIVLLWCLNLVESLPPPNEECDTRLFEQIMPPGNQETPESFIHRVKLREEEELWDMDNNIERLHWHARNSKIKNLPPEEPVNEEIIMERHHAINWVIGYMGLGWDDMVCDT